MLKQVIKKIPGAIPVAKALGLIKKPGDARGFLLQQLPKQGVGAEVGVHLGDFSKRLLEETSPRKLHLIDPWEIQEGEVYKTAWYGGGAEGGQEEMNDRCKLVGERFKDQIAAGQVELNRGYSTDELEKFADGYLDWIYIDGNHMYEYVKKDLEMSLVKTKVGGVIAGDDYHSGGWWGDGVIRAVTEFTDNPAVELIAIRDTQFLFRKVAEA